MFVGGMLSAKVSSSKWGKEQSCCHELKRLNDKYVDEKSKHEKNKKNEKISKSKNE